MAKHNIGDYSIEAGENGLETEAFSIDDLDIGVEISGVYDFVDPSMSVAEINQAIDSASTAATGDAALAVVFKRGTYEIDDFIEGESNVALISRGAHIKPVARWATDPVGPGAIDFLQNKSNFLVHGFSIDGDATETYADYGIRTKNGCENYVIQNNTVRHTADDGITSEDNCANWVIRDNKCFDIGGSVGTDEAAFEVEEGSHSGTLTGNVTDGAEFGVMVKSRSENEVHDVVIEGNHWINCTTQGIRVQGDGANSQSKNVTVKNNTIRNCGSGMRAAAHVDDITFAGNQIVNPSGGGISAGATGTGVLTIRNNTIRDAGTTAIGLSQNGDGSVIAGNSIISPGSRGIQVGNTNTVVEVSIENNTLKDCGFDGGIRVNDTVDAGVSGNRVVNSGGNGIFVASTAVAPKITGNRLKDNDTREIESEGTNVTIHANVLKRSGGGWAIRCSGGSDGSIQSNKVINSQIGIELTTGTSGFIVIHNDVRDTTTPIDVVDSTAPITDPVNQDTTEDYNIT